MRPLVLTVFLSALAGCSSFGGDPALESLETYRAERAQLVEALDAAVGDARADDVGACRVVPVGDKACGGPWTWRAYSTTASDAARVVALAQEITVLDRAANRRFGLVSTCEYVATPEPVLEGGRCGPQPWR